MSISQFIRILWAYRLLIVVSTVICTAAGIATVQLVQPRYVAQSRVMLDVIKPDPVTGQVMATAFLRAYTKTQIELVKDLLIAKRAVADLGWEKDPIFQKAYRERSRSQQNLDFTRWAAESIMRGADAKMIEASNVLEISFKSSSAERAKLVSDSLRKAYIDTTLQSRRDAAGRNADWYENQAKKTKAILFEAELEKAAYERENGILLQEDKVDIDSARLAALATQGGVPMMTPAITGSPPSAAELAQVESTLADAARTLGPNHPQLLALRSRRESLRKQVEQERNTSSVNAGAAMNAARAATGLLDAQKDKVLSQRSKVERLRLMQDEIDLRREQYSKAVARAADLRQESEIAEAGVIPLGNANTPRTPEFPKKGLMIGSSIVGGVGLGILVGLLLELFGRRIRSGDDLKSAIDAPLLAVIRSHSNASRAGRVAQFLRARPNSLKAV